MSTPKFPRAKDIDLAANPPTIVGKHGKAWALDMAAVRQAKGVAEEHDGTVCGWVMYVPWAHPLWSYYMLTAVHLRPIPGHPPAKILLPGATHEVLLAALDPQRAPDLKAPHSCWLSPLNFVGQWVAQERPNPVDLDRAAATKIQGCVDDIIIHGRLCPDTDYVRQWIERFSASNLQ